MLQKSKLLVLLIFWLITGCSPMSLSSASSPNPISTTTFQFENDPFIFTYSTFDGQIFQVNASGQKRQIIPVDKIQKENLSWSPNRALLAYIASEATEGELQRTLWIVGTEGGDARPVFGPVKALRYSWGEDSQTIYVEEAVSFERIPFDEDTSIQAAMIDVETNTTQEVERRTELFPLPISSPNGQRAIWTDPTDNKWTLYLLDNQNNKLSVIYEPPPSRVISGVWSPDSQQLAIIRPEDEEIYLYKIDSDDWLKISSFSDTHKEHMIGNLQWSPNGIWLSYTLNDQEHVSQICVLSVEKQSEWCFDTRSISNQYVWSQDSGHIAYLSKTSSEEVDIFVIDIPKAAIRNLTEDGNMIIEQDISQ